MVDIENLRLTVAKGLKEYLGCPVIRSNQNAPPPAYPYISYTITTPMSENKGTYGIYSDGKARKPVTTTISYTALSDDSTESLTLANKARTWLDFFGRVYLSDRGVVVQSVTSVSNRDNVLTVEYEYKNGFDCIFFGVDEIELPDNGVIETLTMEEDINKQLEDRLDGVESHTFSGNATSEDEETLNKLLAERLDGVT